MSGSQGATAESREARLKRLRLRSWRRGMKEMDIILGGFADAELAALDDVALDAYEALLAEPDADLYAWISGRLAPPERHAPLVRRIQSRLGTPGAGEAQKSRAS
ncbi:MAG: succinate dehydrogenase assembly factor 2 [Alphaproteobacteria bacterium]|nr:MAG: succinate dehydrogenase assembly factor 2 [Alphaproteobacteria bacterium]